MRILYIITELDLGGAEVLLVNLANKMLACGHEVEIVALGAINAHAQTLDKRIQVHLVRMTKDIRGFLKAYRLCWSLARRSRWDVVHAHMFHANVIARLAKPLFRGARLISTAHSNNEGGGARMLVYRLTDFLSDINTNVSQGALDRYLNGRFFSRRKSTCVYNFVDTKLYQADAESRRLMRQQQAIEADEFVLLNVGRHVPEKHQSLLLNAFAVVARRHPRVRLLLVGDGPERAHLEKIAGELGIAARVRFCGSQRNPADWYKAADLFVLTSRIEGFGLVLAEAMASSCPVITTDVGGCAEVVGDAGTKVPSDSVDALAAAIESHIGMDSGQRMALGALQRSRIVQLFDIDTIVRQWQALYAHGLAGVPAIDGKKKQ